MEKATLIKLPKAWEVQFPNNKKMTIHWKNIPDSFNNQEVQILRERGNVVKIICQKQEIVEQKTTIHTSSMPMKPSQNANHKVARAPYNFVPLPPKVVPTNALQEDRDKYSDNLLSGYINLEIQAITPLFIKGTGNNFFKIGDRYVIPGSSIRGLLRTQCEILSFAKFNMYDDRFLYFRKSGRDASNNRRLGFLIKESNGDFGIYEATNTPQTINSKSNTSNEFTYKLKKVDQNNYSVEIYAGTMGKNNFSISYKRNNVSYKIPDTVIYSYTQDKSRNAKGDMADLIQTAKEHHKSKFGKNLKEKEVDYIGFPVWYSVSKDNQVEHFGHCKNYRVPYQYSIGSKQHIPEELQNDDITDFVEGLFGSLNTGYAGKLAFEDLTCSTEKPEYGLDILQILSSPKPTSYLLYLEQNGRPPKNWNSDAKIRGYKQYWHKNTDQSSDKLLNWRKSDFRTGNDSPTLERGINSKFNQISNPKKKVKSLEDLNQQDQLSIINTINHDTKSQFHIINPVKPDTIFKNGTIRFENLTAEELGLLLLSLNTGENSMLKLGMGKPLGLGSVKIISPNLFLTNRQKRYQSLLDENGDWSLDTEDKSIEISSYIDKFKDYVISKLDGDGQSIIEERLKVLNTMQTFYQKDNPSDLWLHSISYQSLDEFKEKKVLPKPSEVIKPSK